MPARACRESDLSSAKRLHFDEKTLRKKLSAWDEALCGAKGRPNWRLKLRKSRKVLEAVLVRANLHMRAILPIRGF
jgi:hypothetical protein